MFGKKCYRCSRKIARDFEFCPYCGYNLKRESEERDFGLLGKDDNMKFQGFGMRMPFGFDRIFSSLINQVDKQFRELDKEIGKDLAGEKEKFKAEKMPKFARGISVSIATETGKKPEIKISGFGPGFENISQQIQKQTEEKPIEIKKLPKEISEERARKLAKLPRKEAETSVRRLSNKIIYELDLPEVKSLKDVFINKLENSIEIKAFSKDKVYFKLIPLGLSILDYKLEDEKLILELKTKS